MKELDINCKNILKIGVMEVKWEDVEKFDRHQDTDNLRPVIYMSRKFRFSKMKEISEQLRKSLLLQKEPDPLT